MFRSKRDKLIRKKFNEILKDKDFVKALQLSSNDVDVNSMRNIFFTHEGWLLHKYYCEE